MTKKVVILGGGVAGMSAAHELVERGFEVHVYERQSIPGGKARSIPVPNTGTDGREDLPGEHGFRFFPRFYRHVTDTMKRIPYKDNRQGVFDNLVQTTRILIGEFDKPPMIMLSRSPRSAAQIYIALTDIFSDLPDEMRITEPEIELFSKKLWQILTSCNERRIEEYEKIGWWRFIEADKYPGGYQKFLAQGMTRSLVAANAYVANVRSEGDIGLRLIMDVVEPGISSDRVLNGPTNDVWINPWLAYLEARGVHYHLDHRLISINCKDGMIESATIEDKNGKRFDVTGDYYLAAVPLEVMARLLDEDKDGDKPGPLLKADPSLQGIIDLVDIRKCIAWMNGIQFYLTEDVPITHGHAIYIDSPWALTSISQKQFWPDVDLGQFGDGKVKGIISVDISEWNQAGRFTGKKASECTREEIKHEIWEELKHSLNYGEKGVILRDDMLHAWFLDPDIEDVGHFFQWLSKAPGLEQLDEETERKYRDAEPLFIALVDTWHDRPGNTTLIPNLFLASDYIRTNTQLATMEAANEAARRAVNSIIDASGSNAPYCKIWKIHESAVFAPYRWYDQYRYNRGLTWKSTAPWLFRFLQWFLVEGEWIWKRIGNR